MIDRDEVDRILDSIKGNKPTARASITSERLAALCRAWLAVESAPVRNVVGQQWDDVFAREGNVVWCSDMHPGQRVRIVPVEGGG